MMQAFAIVWIVLGAAVVAAAAVMFLVQGLGPASRSVILTLSCIGVPFLAFGIWGLYAEMKPYHYEPKRRQ